ncbi:MAG: DUF5069 domain-containing protein [Chloroflexota bacterium]|jgi:hypothetical protein|nr:DUF5069 domain-containing protein [Chloroflexota bacterium]
MDLTTKAPRSPYVKIGHIVFVARTLDKVRAELAGTLGSYHWRVGTSATVLEWLGIDADELLAAMPELADDAAAWNWIEARMTRRTDVEIASFNAAMIERRPEGADSRRRHREYLEEVGITEDLEALGEVMTSMERLEWNDRRETEPPAPGIDLTTGVPRSPYERMLGMVFLPRTIDKARAELAGKGGEYLFRGGQSAPGLDLLGITPEELFEALCENPTDADIRAWITANAAMPGNLEIARYNRYAIERRARTPEQIEWHRNYLAGIGIEHLAEILTMYERLEWDENR